MPFRACTTASTPYLPGAVFGRVIKGFDRHGAAEALVDSVVFGIPMVIEGGVLGDILPGI